MRLIQKVMKNTILGFIGLLLIYCGNLYSEVAVAQNNQTREGTINILSTPDLVNLAARWANELLEPQCLTGWSLPVLMHKPLPF